MARSLSFKSMRSRIAVALAAMGSILLLLAGYAGYLTFVDGLRLRDVGTLHQQVYSPSTRLIAELQRERHLAVDLLARPSGAQRRELDAQYEVTRKVAATFLRTTSDDAVTEAAGDSLAGQVEAVASDLSALETIRASVDEADSGWQRTATGYTSIINGALAVVEAMPTSSVPGIGQRHRTLVALQQAREALAREVTMLSGALAANTFGATEYETFVELRGTQKYLLDAAATGLDTDQLARYERAVRDDAFQHLRELESEVAVAPESSGDDRGNASGRTPESNPAQSQPVVPFSSTTWDAAGAGAIAALQGLEADFAGQLLTSSQTRADSLLFRAYVIVIGGTLLMLLLVLVWIVVAPKHVIGELTKLRATAHRLAMEQLPHVVERLKLGQAVDAGQAAPPVTFGPDEFGDVGRAINDLGLAAVESTVLAADERSQKDILVSLARRTQGLVHRQLSVLDKMERRIEDPDDLEQLYVLDHAATQLRRYAENLIILAGGTPRRQWRNPVPMMDVIRSGAGEVPDYPRVTVRPIHPPAKLTGRAVADVTHLLAELIENATRFSPPHTKVLVTGEHVANGFVVEIEDRGLGIKSEDLELYNDRLTNTPKQVRLTDTVQLGLFVVGQLAQRHRIEVRLRRSPYGGTTAIVLIPSGLMGSADNGSASATGADTPIGQEVAAPAAPGAVADENTGFQALEGEDTDAPSPAASDPAAGPPLPARREPGGGSETADQLAPERVEAAGSGQPAEPGPDADPAGLPRRVRQASLTAELREEASVPAAAPSHPPLSARTPEQVRSAYGAFQRGTARGRANDVASGEVAQSAGNDRPKPSPRPPTAL